MFNVIPVSLISLLHDSSTLLLLKIQSRVVPTWRLSTPLNMLAQSIDSVEARLMPRVITMLSASTVSCRLNSRAQERRIVID